MSQKASGIQNGLMATNFRLIIRIGQSIQQSLETVEHESKGEERGERTKRVSRYHGSHVRRTYSNDNGFHFCSMVFIPNKSVS